MRTVEEDAERVRAVHAVLEGPMTVWAVRWQNRSGNDFDLFRTEAGARTQLAQCLDEEWEGCQLSEEEYRTKREEILDGKSVGFDDGDERWYSCHSEIVNP